MADDRIQITRASLMLGILPRTEAEELLRVGFLQPTDLGRAEESQPWKPLGELFPTPASKAGTLDKVKGLARSVKAGASQAAAKVRFATNRGSTAVGAVAARLLEDYLPRLRESATALLTDSVGAVETKLHDDAFLHRLFGALYDTLPNAIRRFVSEETFIEFCFKHRSKLLSPKV